MSTYQGEERRDQSDRGKDLRKVVGDGLALMYEDRLPPQRMLYLIASQAWRLGFERGRAEGMGNAMDAVDRELGALREGLKED